MASEDGDKELSPAQLEKIKRYLRDRGALYRALGSSMTSRRKSPTARLAVSGNKAKVKEMVSQLMGTLKNELHELTCKKFDWCKKKSEKLYQLIVSIVKILIPLYSGKAAAIANIVFMVQEYMFDELCECAKQSA